MEGNVTGLQKKKNVICLGLIVLVIVAGVGFYVHYDKKQKAVLAQRESLTATGLVEATTVNVAFKVAGRIDKMLVDTGSTIVVDQEIANLESREIEAKVLQALGGVQAAQALADEAGSSIHLTSRTVEAKVEQAQAAYDNSKQQYERVKALHDGGAASDSSLDQAVNDLKAKQGLLDEAIAARLNLEVIRQKYQAAVGNKQSAEGLLLEAQTALDNTHMKSPVDGIVTQKYLDAGEMVNAGTPVYEISDLKHPYVKVFIDETKIGRVSLNQDVDVQVDAYPQRVFKGKVVWINDAGQFAVHKAINEQFSHDIRSFEVKINLSNEDLALKTGMTARVVLN